MSIEIKPCLWCGNDGLIIFKPTEGKKHYQVCCILCESLGPWKATEGEAIEAHNQVAGLREENERLKKQALIWKQWPENEAPEQVRCLAKDVNGNVYIGEYLPTRGMPDWLLDGFDWRDPAVIVAYAEIPRPEDR
jgi:hypothetical protein